MVEKVDAYGMVAWAATELGDLAKAEQISAHGLSQIQPGQVPAAALHLVAWRTPHGVYWISNTLTDQLKPQQMVGIAASFTRVR